MKTKSHYFLQSLGLDVDSVYVYYNWFHAQLSHFVSVREFLFLPRTKIRQGLMLSSAHKSPWKIEKVNKFLTIYNLITLSLLIISVQIPFKYPSNLKLENSFTQKANFLIK